MAIDNENLQMVELLVVMGLDTQDALLHAIDKEFVEAVELLLEHEELIHQDGTEYVSILCFLYNSFVSFHWFLFDSLEVHVHLTYCFCDQSWEKVDRTTSSFTSDITPLILAAHRNNYEILKILLDRGASLPMPHDVR